jgi:sialate O-acetylesterase
MIRFSRISLLLAFIAGAAWAQAALPQVSPFFQSHMVMQRDTKAPVWGWDTPGTKVTVSLDGKAVATATADKDGTWSVKLGPVAAGGPHTLTIAGTTTVTLDDILFGDVWICSGQSNMEQGMQIVNNAKEEIAAADYPQIRLLQVNNAVALEPQRTFAGTWTVCTPATVAQGGWGGFSAVGYFFGREVHKAEQVPVGLIDTNWGGTVAQAWTSGPALKALPDFKAEVEKAEALAAAMRRGDYDYERELAAWWTRNDPGTQAKYADPATEVKAWKAMKLPANWENAGLAAYDGIVWFRKDVVVPDEWAGKDLTLSLSPIDDNETTYINGEKVGGMNNWNSPRVYTVPGKLVKAGKNLIAIRVLDTGGGGGLFGTPEQMSLSLKGDAAQKLSLAGDWSCQATKALREFAEMPPARADGNPNAVSALYNAMIAPLQPAAVKGAIWYQGESNAGNPKQYRTLLPAMIADWRAGFSAGDFPFLVVSLANFMAVQTQPSEGGWAELREAQWLTSKNVKNVGLALAIDIGDAGDIHPRNKQDVGRRLFLNAEVLAYGKKIVSSGPQYQSMKVDGDKVRLTFTSVGAGLTAKGDKLIGFAIAGADGKFVWADAVIDGNTVVVSAKDVPAPVAVRYGWANNPTCTCITRTGCPRCLSAPICSAASRQHTAPA